MSGGPGRAARAVTGSLLVVASILGCSARRAAPPAGPPPEYERSPVTPWDAGIHSDVDPFAGAAEGGWIDETDDATRVPVRSRGSAEPARDAGFAPVRDGAPG